TEPVFAHVTSLLQIKRRSVRTVSTRIFSSYQPKTQGKYDTFADRAGGAMPHHVRFRSRAVRRQVPPARRIAADPDYDPHRLRRPRPRLLAAARRLHDPRLAG